MCEPSKNERIQNLKKSLEQAEKIDVDAFDFDQIIKMITRGEKITDELDQRLVYCIYDFIDSVTEALPEKLRKEIEELTES